MNDFLRLDKVVKIYENGPQGFTALKKISCAFAQGEYAAIVGPSGAGKSTLLHVSGGLEPPTKGRVFYQGKNIYDRGDYRLSLWRNRRAGFVFQFYHLIEELTVAENVALPYLISRGRSKTAFKKAYEMLQYLEIGDKRSGFPSELSGGQKQKVALARALINDPEIIFCDEPTGNLDTVSAQKVLDLLSFLHKEEKKTVIMVTHNPEIAARAERILTLREGEIVCR